MLVRGVSSIINNMSMPMQLEKLTIRISLWKNCTTAEAIQNIIHIVTALLRWGFIALRCFIAVARTFIIKINTIMYVAETLGPYVYTASEPNSFE